MLSEDTLPQLTIIERQATITLCRPAVANRLEPEDLVALLDHINAVNASDVLVLRIRSEGKYFCSGINIGTVGAKKSIELREVTDALASCRPVTIAALQGGLYGGATDLALCCDFRLGTPQANMFVPAAKLGLLYYSSGIQRFVSRLGVDAAKRILLLADKLDANEMLQYGFLTELINADELDARLDEMTNQLQGMAPLSLVPLKKYLNQFALGKFDSDQFMLDAKKALQSNDIKEGALAWREKRSPCFTGS